MHTNLRNTLPENQWLELIAKYETGKYLCSDLSTEFQVSRPAISIQFKKRGIKLNKHRARTNRKYTLNEQYFDVIDTQEKAYFLGFLYADGTNCKNGRRVDLTLAEEDKEILEKLAALVESNKPLIRVKIKDRQPTRQDQFCFSMNGTRISQRLTDLGCMNNKTFKLKFPTKEQVPEHLRRHFIRGYFDGDGGISFTMPPSRNCMVYKISITSTQDMLNSIKYLIQKDLLVNISIRPSYAPKRDKKIIMELDIVGRKQVMAFLDWMYKDASISLQRKFNKYREMQEYLLNKSAV